MIIVVVVGIIIFLFGLAAFTGAPYVPTKPKDAERVFRELYRLGKEDVLVDIGSGDGMMLRSAARHGATAIGYEINPLLVLISRLLSLRDARVKIHFGDYWRANFPDSTTVVYTFGETRDIAKMAKKVQREANRLGRRIAFISYVFEVPGVKREGAAGMHYLYYFHPLQK